LAQESTLDGVNRTLDEYMAWFQSHDHDAPLKEVLGT
jgi:hypothetical protein